MSVGAWVRCAKCDKNKAPMGRSVPLEMHGTLCLPLREYESGLIDGCEGYYRSPSPECRWPGEDVCGPGCDRK
jgi:hypothetical protein